MAAFFNFVEKMMSSKSYFNGLSGGRKSIRLKNHDYSSVGYYFITMCCQNRLRWMGEVVDGKMKLNEIGKMIFKEWLSTEQKRGNVKLHEFVIMPDHFHGLIEITHSVENVVKHEKFYCPKNTIGSIVRGFKSSTTTQLYNYISSHELHWRRGELIFAPNTTGREIAPNTTGMEFVPNTNGKEFAPNEQEMKSALHDSEMNSVLNNSEHGSTSKESEKKFVKEESAFGRGELIFAPNEPGMEFAPNEPGMEFAPNEPGMEFVPNEPGKEFAPNEHEMKSALHNSEMKSAFHDSEMNSVLNNSKHESTSDELEKTCAPFKLWQRGYYDRFIRTHDELNAIKNYIKANPLRWTSRMNENSF